ncbi:Dentin sialophosphoprotein-like [Abeliophyllum distichum]|uniref:Dentin sialophosphoprotein-like n=1 Tax=Abeliophyllum distichum TaxID=126358 RepID=A0ABD1TXK8_9LAMI
MATRTRETTPGKEKRGTSPSYPKKIPNSKSSSPDKTASDKHIPNYLKPTISSGPDASKQLGKKLASTDNANKPNLTRRRSFDKPPSPSRTQKSRISPNPTLRSSSFSSKTTMTTHKSIPDKLLKTPPKDAGKRSFIARPSKKSSPSNKKQDTARSGSITKEQVNSPDKSDALQVDIGQALQVDIGQEEQVSSVTDAEYEETVHVVSNYELGPEFLVLEDKEPISITRQAEPEIVTDEDVVTVESYKVSEQPDISLGVETKELPEDEPKVETTTGNQQELEEHILNEKNPTQSDETLADNSKAEVEEKEGAKALDGIETIDSEELEMEQVVEEVKLETENEESKQEDSEKKKDSTLSNDVIEETASKLREQRKNKVKALAGAFETVISLQDPK